MADALSRPALTLPPEEAAVLRGAYARAGTILEYGSGGSTVLAAELPGKTVLSVESDADWASDMTAWFAANPPAPGTAVHMLHSDIGPTEAWGRPADDSAWRHWPRYPLAVWQREDCMPDVVLVDGRFRIGCALATAFRTSKPVTLLFDDYTTRPHYARVEDYLGTPEIVGRMARFRVTPTAIPPERLLQVVQFMQRP